MSAAVATPTITKIDNTQALIHLLGSIAVTASPATYTAGGVTCSFAGFDAVKASGPPLTLRANSQASGGASGYIYQFIPGTTQANGLLQIFTGAAAQSPLTELTNGATIPAVISSDTIFFEAIFNRI